MNKTAVKVIGIISLITFLIGLTVSIFAIVGGNHFLNISADAYESSEFVSEGTDLLMAIISIFGGGIFIVAGVVGTIYDIIAHVPALIAYLVGRKGNHVTAYWLLISLWICLLFGISFFILVF